MKLLSADPSMTATGLALYKEGTLTQVALVRAKTLTEQIHKIHAFRGWVPDEVALEFPVIYPRGKEDPNDLLKVAAAAGACVNLAKTPQAAYYEPRQWKGQMPKSVCGRRIRASLSDFENKVLDRYFATVPKGLQHNVLDAVGVGLKHLRRF